MLFSVCYTQLEQYKSQAGKCDEEARSIESGSPSVNIPFVKKWVKTRHAILFRMSNRVVQVRNAGILHYFTGIALKLMWLLYSLCCVRIGSLRIFVFRPVSSDAGTIKPSKVVLIIDL